MPLYDDKSIRKILVRQGKSVVSILCTDRGKDKGVRIILTSGKKVARSS
jgi:hypothetical protein